MRDEKLKLGVIGGGLNSAVGSTHKIATEMDSLYTVQAGCFSRNEDLNHQSSVFWGAKNTYPNYVELLNSERKEIDVILVLSPSDTHFEIVSKCIEMGYSVVCEKPLVGSNTELQKLKKVLLNKKEDQFVLEVNNYTGFPMLREMKSLIKQGKIGKINHIQIEMPQEGFIKKSLNGAVPTPQKWRLSDGEIPTIHLDLGVHIHNILRFLGCGILEPISSTEKNFGAFNGIVDHVLFTAKTSNDITIQSWFSKAALGHRNGLKVIVYGECGSFSWVQETPEHLVYVNNYGQRTVLDRGSPELVEAQKPRYCRFKAGHPAGFIEAFANYYVDIHNAISAKCIRESNEWLLPLDSSVQGIEFLYELHSASKK